ncbi:hypothetical protein THAOC_22321 [Thalassiosira oceanica]|uniref:Uncharacterized protein n=1 Tax=Thalassiosira oceanica TaxID=159749 RepID=K0RXE1_THAOC|nr:hypothetical protein THAOC_22321 [Thalassiosira oceanica]|eukprot:EJK57615.1 hypothetical protein THAOC_22321 [Thalassiosira oceanica]
MKTPAPGRGLSNYSTTGTPSGSLGPRSSNLATRQQRPQRRRISNHAPPIQTSGRAVRVAIVRGNAQHKLSRLHDVRATPEEAADACRANHSNSRRSCRTAGGLRRLSESRALPTFPSWPEAPESKESGRPPRVDGDGFLRYRLGWEPILAVKVSILRGEQRVTSGFFLSHVPLLQAADVAGNRLSRIRANTPPGEGDGPGGVFAQFARMSSVETAATRFNNSVGRSTSYSLKAMRGSARLENPGWENAAAQKY